MWDVRSLRYRDGAIDAPAGAEPEGLSRIILLIHGYANDRREATASYAAFEQHFPEGSSIRKQMWKFFWPGFVEPLWGWSAPVHTAPEYEDTGGHRGSGGLTAVSYSAQVPKAVKVGRALGQYLLTLRNLAGGPTEVVLVAHSLGNRVALEALREIAQQGGQIQRGRLPGVCLMAAAVPTFMVGPTASARFASAADIVRKSYVLFSRSDWVLRFLFGVGQLGTFLFYDGEETAPDTPLAEAIGRHGNPHSTWLRRGDSGLGHGGYWSSRTTGAPVLQMLGNPVPNDLPLSHLRSTRWTLPESHVLPDWKLRGERQRY